MNKFVTGAMVGLLSLGLVACSGESSEPTKVDSGNAEASGEKSSADKENKEKKDEPKVFAVGDSIKKDGKVVTVTKVKRSQGTEMDKPDKGNEYVIVSVKIANKGEEKISYNPFNYSLKNAQGQINDQAMALIDQDTHLNSGKLAPGGKVSGTIVFQAPKKSTNKDLTLIIKGNMFSSEGIKVNLGK